MFSLFLLFSACKEPETRSVHELQTSWAVGSLPPEPVLGNDMPTFPTLPPLSANPSNEELMRRLEVLVRGHPAELVRRDLSRAIGSGLIQVSFEDQDNKMATFAHLPSRDGGAASTLLVVGRAHLIALDTPQSVVDMELALYHEAIHLVQWRDGSDVERDYFVPTPADQMTPEHCGYKFRIEREAYWAECQMGISWGTYGHLEDLCRRVTDRVEFNKALFVGLAQTEAGRRGSCFPWWAKEAGHPYWEAYL